jgi:hypothetical protein
MNIQENPQLLQTVYPNWDQRYCNTTPERFTQWNYPKFDIEITLPISLFCQLFLLAMEYLKLKFRHESQAKT